MMLQTFLALVGIGIAVFSIGVLAKRPGISFVASIFIITAGAIGVTGDGVMLQVGQDIVVTNTTNGSIENVTAVYEPAEGVSDFSPEILALILGAVLAIFSAQDMG